MTFFVFNYTTQCCLYSHLFVRMRRSVGCVSVDDGWLLHSLDAADSFVVSLFTDISRSLLPGAVFF